MLSEYQASFCFIRSAEAKQPVLEATEQAGAVAACGCAAGKELMSSIIEEELRRMLPSISSMYIEEKAEDGLEIVVCEVNGLSPLWDSELELEQHLEQKMPETSHAWLYGYQLELQPKEDAGPCLLTKKG